jgi:hypothetical protein
VCAFLVADRLDVILRDPDAFAVRAGDFH